MRQPYFFDINSFFLLHFHLLYLSTFTMAKSSTTTPSLTIRLKLNTIQTDDSAKVQKSSSSPKSKSRKKTHSKKRKSK